MNDDGVVRREHGREVVDALLQPPMKRAKKKRGQKKKKKQAPEGNAEDKGEL